MKYSYTSKFINEGVPTFMKVLFGVLLSKNTRIIAIKQSFQTFSCTQKGGCIIAL